MKITENKKVSTQLEKKRKLRSISKPKPEPMRGPKLTSKIGLKSKAKPKNSTLTKPKLSVKTAKVSDSHCPLGLHWVRAHPMRVPPSDKNLTGITIRRPHCARNPGYRQTLTLREVERIEKLAHKKLADPKNPKSGRGLMQLLDLSRRS